MQKMRYAPWSMRCRSGCQRHSYAAVRDWIFANAAQRFPLIPVIIMTGIPTWKVPSRRSRVCFRISSKPFDVNHAIELIDCAGSKSAKIDETQQVELDATY